MGIFVSLGLALLFLGIIFLVVGLLAPIHIPVDLVNAGWILFFLGLILVLIGVILLAAGIPIP